MLVLVCGSRHWGDWTAKAAIYDRLCLLPHGTTVMHGDARGVDRFAAETARMLGLAVETFPADWATHGRKAGIIRNLEMLDRNPDLVLAFQKDGSRGTQHVIDEARKRGLPVELIHR